MIPGEGWWNSEGGDADVAADTLISVPKSRSHRADVRVLVVGDRSGFIHGTAAGDYVALIVKGLEPDAQVDVVPGFTGQPLDNGRATWLKKLVQLARGRSGTIVYYYGHSTLTMVLCWLASRANGGSLVVALVEWPPAHPSAGLRQSVGRRVFAAVATRLPDGHVVISRYLEDRVRSRTNRERPRLLLPILIDPEEWHGIERQRRPQPEVVYCADLDGYLEDAEFVLAAFASAGLREHRLHLVGRASAGTIAHLRAVAANLGVDPALRISSTGLGRRELLETFAGSDALLAPLADDVRSKARFPSKLGPYLMSGSPLVASAVGEVDRYLQDGDTAFLAAPGDLDSFASKLREAVTTPRGRAVGRRGRELAAAQFDYRLHGARLRAFLGNVRRSSSEGSNRHN